MWTSGFFNSVNGDRLYNADQMSRIFEGLITDGVYESVGNKLAVQPNGGMTIQIGTGRGWVGKHWFENNSEYILTVEPSDVVLNRYVAVMVKADNTETVRDVIPYLKYSDFATEPVIPTVTRTETVEELCLAYIPITAGMTEIKASDIVDTRADESVCGWVAGLIQQLSSATLWTQWEALFKEWFNGLQDFINENTEAMLVSALPTSVTLTLTAAGWESENGIYKQSVEVVNMTDTKSVLVYPSSATATAYSASEITCSAQSTNTLEFTAVTAPTTDIMVDVLHMGV